MQEPTQHYLMEEEESINIKHLLRKYLRFWPWFVLSLMVTLTGSYLYVRYTSKVYQTNAKIKIIDKSKDMGFSVGDMVFNQSQINLENEIQVLSSYRIIEKVVENLELTTVIIAEGDIKTKQLDSLPFVFERILHPEKGLPTGSFEITVTKEGFEVLDLSSETVTKIPYHDSYLIDHELPFQIKLEDPTLFNKYTNQTYKVILTSKRGAVLALKGALQFESLGKSDLIKITMKGQSTSRSERIINELIKVFDEDGIEDRQLIYKHTIDFIDNRFLFLVQQLDSIELNKKEFKQSNNLVYIEGDTRLSLEKKAKSDEDLFRLENQLTLSELLSEALKNSDEKSGLLPQNIGLENNTANNLIEEYNLAVLERDKLIGSGGINNPVVQQLIATLNGLRSNIDSSISAYKKQLEVSKQQLVSRSNRFSSEVYQLPEKEKLLRAINRQQEIKESLYLLLLQKREEAAINLAAIEPSIKVVEYALSNSGPISPKPKIAYMGAAVLGLFIPFGILFIIFMLDTKVHSRKDIDALGVDIPILGEIPALKIVETDLFSNPNDRTVLAESFRIISSNANFMLPSNTGKGAVLNCTSSIKGEGKTFISVNISLALSSLNKKVLLLGADLRNPQFFKYLGVEKNQAGLTHYLHDQSSDWEDLLIKGFPGHPNHDTLISGEIPPNPPHLFSNGRYKTLIEEARELYDFIVVDTAPTVLVTDTMLISEYADATLFIVRANFTDKELLQHSLDFLKKNKVKNMAYIINSVGENGKAYGYKYGYNYGYGYGYHQET